MLVSFDDAPSTALSDVFTFSAAPLPTCRLSFCLASGQPGALGCCELRQSHKRSRPLSDVDGEPAGGCKKKRRLRRFLITSRLSRPFSSPPTHIVDRGLSKIAVWAKQKASNRNQLRKAAILNSIKIHVAEARETERRQMEQARQAFMHQSTLVQIPRREYIPLPPSPLGLSNYDAFDLEEDYMEGNFEDGDEADGYRDFDLLDPNESVVNDYDSLDKNDMDTPKSWSSIAIDNDEADMVEEKKRQKDLCFSPLHTFGPRAITVE